MTICARCGEDNPERARYCMACTAPLGRASASETRRVVTLVFSDLVGSTALGERLDPEALREVLTRYFDVMRRRLEAHGGTVEKYIGDAIMAVFGLPHAREDDALRAALAALEMQTSLTRLNEELHQERGVRLSNRTGVYTGEVVAGDPAAGQRLVTGDAVNTAARLEQAAATDEILIGAPTYQLLRHAGTFEEAPSIVAKGKADPVRAYRLVTIEATDPMPRRPHASMVGRIEQLDALGTAFRDSIGRRRTEIVLIVGDPGVGKTRLAEEFIADWRGRALTVHGRCLPETRDSSFWALTQAVRHAAGIEDDHSAADALRRLADLTAGASETDMITDRLASVLGITTEVFPAEEVVWGFRRLLQHLAADRPVLFVLEDVQWAGAATLDAVAGLCGGDRDAPVLIVCLSRPELLDEQAGWIAGLDDSTFVDLRPLSLAESTQLIVDIVGRGTLSHTALKTIHESAQGNPLFVEQMVATWLDDEVLVPAGDGWVVRDPDRPLPIPPSIRALLAARLDALRDLERAVVERGSVIGELFRSDAVAAMMPAADVQVDGPLSSLETKRLLQPDRTRPEDANWSFVHRLVRDAAYVGMLKRTRSTLHERYADWLGGSAKISTPEHQVIVATHLEQAAALARELGQADARTDGLGSRAAGLFEAAAVDARDRMLHGTAGSLYERAAECVPSDSAESVRLLSRASEMAIWEGDVERAELLVTRVPAIETDVPTRIRLELVRLWIQESRSGRDNADHLTEGRRIVHSAREQHDVEGAAWGLRFVARYLGWLGRVGEARQVSLEAIDSARAAGRRDIELNAQTNYAMGSIFDESPVAETLAWCRRTVARSPDDRILMMELSRPMAILSAMQGDEQEAEKFLSMYTRMIEEFGMTPALRAARAEAGAFLAGIAGDPARVERELGDVYRDLCDQGDTNMRASMAGLLAYAAAVEGRFDTAIRLSDDAEQVASGDDYDAQTRWRTSRAVALARTGRVQEAESLAEAASKIVAVTEDTNLYAEALVVHAEVLRMTENADDGRSMLEEAIGRFEAKGCTRSAARARSLLAECR